MMNDRSPHPSRAGAHPQDAVSDGGKAQGATPAAQPNASDPGNPHTRPHAAGARESVVHESRALTLHRRHLPALKPEVIIEIPPPVDKRRRFVWLSAGLVPLIITVIALAVLATRSQRVSNTTQEATVEALVALRLAEERANPPRRAVNVALEATVEARVALRLAEERAAWAQQSPPTASEADEPRVAAPDVDENAAPQASASQPLSRQTAGATPVADESALFYGQASVVLHLRRGPGAEYPSLELIPAGARLRLLGRTGDSGWFFVSKTDGSPADETGWVAAWLVTIPADGDPMRLAVVSPLSPATQNE